MSNKIFLNVSFVMPINIKIPATSSGIIKAPVFLIWLKYELIWKLLFSRTLSDENIITNKVDVIININAIDLFNAELFSIKNFSITLTTNNPAIAWNADKAMPDKNNK